MVHLSRMVQYMGQHNLARGGVTGETTVGVRGGKEENTTWRAGGGGEARVACGLPGWAGVRGWGGVHGRRGAGEKKHQNAVVPPSTPPNPPAASRSRRPPGSSPDPPLPIEERLRQKNDPAQAKTGVFDSSVGAQCGVSCAAVSTAWVTKAPNPSAHCLILCDTPPGPGHLRRSTPSPGGQPFAAAAQSPGREAAASGPRANTGG